MRRTAAVLFAAALAAAAVVWAVRRRLAQDPGTREET
jgi:hypothetical protein